MIEAGKISRYRKNGVALDEESAFLEGNGYFIEELLKIGKRVVYLIDVPQFKFGPIDCERRGATGCTLNEPEFINSR